VFSWGKNLPVGEEKEKGELLDSFAENSAQILEGGIFSFSIKFPKVPIKSSIFLFQSSSQRFLSSLQSVPPKCSQ